MSRPALGARAAGDHDRGRPADARRRHDVRGQRAGTGRSAAQRRHVDTRCSILRTATSSPIVRRCCSSTAIAGSRQRTWWSCRRRRPDSSRADLHFRVTEGQQTIVDHILIIGNTRTDERVIKRELLLQEGKAARPRRSHRKSTTARRARAVPAHSRRGTVARQRGQRCARDGGGSLGHDLQLRRWRRGQRSAHRRCRRAGRGTARVRAARILRRRTAQPWRQEPHRRSVYARELASERFKPRIDRHAIRSASPNIASSEPIASRAPLASTPTSRSPPPSNRAGARRSTLRAKASTRRSPADLAQACAVSGRYSFGTTRTFDEKLSLEDQARIDRVFPQVRLSGFSGAISRDTRDDVLDPERGTFLQRRRDRRGARARRPGRFPEVLPAGFWFHRLPAKRRVVFASRVALGLADGFPARRAGNRHRGTSRSPSRSRTFPQANVSLPAATRRSAASRSTPSARPTRSARPGFRAAATRCF